MNHSKTSDDRVRVRGFVLGVRVLPLTPPGRPVRRSIISNRYQSLVTFRTHLAALKRYAYRLRNGRCFRARKSYSRDAGEERASLRVSIDYSI